MSSPTWDGSTMLSSFSKQLKWDERWTQLHSRDPTRDPPRHAACGLRGAQAVRDGGTRAPCGRVPMQLAAAHLRRPEITGVGHDLSGGQGTPGAGSSEGSRRFMDLAWDVVRDTRRHNSGFPARARSRAADELRVMAGTEPPAARGAGVLRGGRGARRPALQSLRPCPRIRPINPGRRAAAR